MTSLSFPLSSGHSIKWQVPEQNVVSLAVESVVPLTCRPPVLGGSCDGLHLDGLTELLSHHEADCGTEMTLVISPGQSGRSTYLVRDISR